MRVSVYVVITVIAFIGLPCLGPFNGLEDHLLHFVVKTSSNVSIYSRSQWSYTTTNLAS